MKIKMVLNFTYKTFCLLLLCCFLSLPSWLYAAVPVSDYGLLPAVRSVDISPDGKHIALISSNGEDEVLKVIQLASRKLVGGLKFGDINADDIFFADNDTVILKGSDTKRVFGYRGKINLSGSYAYTISTDEIVVLLNKTKGLHPAQSGLGRIVGFDKKNNRVLMPAYEKAADGLYHLYTVSLRTGLGRTFKRGNSHTIDWFVGENANLLAREDYDNKRELHRIYSYIDGSPKIIYESKTPRVSFALSAVSAKEKSLLLIESGEVFEMSLEDGELSETNLGKSDHGIAYLDTDLNRKLISVRYTGLLNFSELKNANLAKAYMRIEKLFQNSQISFQSSTKDESQIIVQVSGNESAGGYYLFDSAKNSLIELGREYPEIEQDEIGEITTVSYSAQDGTKIPTVLTWPVGAKQASEKKKALPLIVFPHGGPRAHDGIRFDWWAQYFASRGYLVMQPNFRGSTGFGVEHLEKGDGEWGRAMQDDVSEGVRVLVAKGYADPKRVCIVGASYGGYSALAGGAFSPELYRCVIAVAGVSDLPRMLSSEKRTYGPNHWVVRYWHELIGDSKTEREKLKNISPVNFADNFIAPTLLIHGKDDTVVPILQSRVMHKALRKAKKDTTLVELKGEDHWLSTSRTRLEMLKAIDKFVNKHNPA